MVGRDREYTDDTYMETLYITKIIKNGGSKGVMIPAVILDGLGWERGDQVIFTFASDDSLVIKKLDEQTIKRIRESGSVGDEPTVQI